MAVLIVGGGLAGQLSALFLARKGIKSCLVDPNEAPQDRVCGEGILPLGWKALRELDNGSLKSLGWPIRGIEYRCANRKVLGQLKAEGLGIHRGKLDQWLREKIKSEPLITREYKQLRLEEIPFGSVLATGTQSQISSRLKLNVQKKSFYGIRFRIRAEEIPHYVSVSFASWGEIYLTPISSDQLSVAMLCRQGGAPRNLEQAIHILKKSFPHLGLDQPEGFAARSPIQCRPKKRPSSFFCVGDAHQTFDPISGAGMSFAIHSAACLARHWENGDFENEMKPIREHFDCMTRMCLLLSGRAKLTQFFLLVMQKKPQRFEGLLQAYNGGFSKKRILFALAKSIY